MLRYDPTVNIGNRWDGKQVFLTRIYPPIPPSNSDILYITNDSDYLDTLAQKFYGDVTLWFIIANANGCVISHFFTFKATLIK